MFKYPNFSIEKGQKITNSFVKKSSNLVTTADWFIERVHSCLLEFVCWASSEDKTKEFKKKFRHSKY